jgi:modulator of FtsH protease
MNPQFQPMALIQASDVSINRVLRNTYTLLGMTMLFSALTAFFSMSINAQPNFILVLAGMFGLMFLTTKLQNSPWGIVSCFAFTGFLGYTIGPILNQTIHGFSNGSQLILTSLGATGAIFLALSAYVITTRRDFTFMGGFLFIAVSAAFLAGIANIFFHLPLLQLAVSGAFAIISSGYILFTTSLIIQGGERNYIMATMSLFISLFNLFLSLLQILSFFAGRKD